MLLTCFGLGTYRGAASSDRPLTDSVKGDRGLAGHGTGGTGSSAASSAATGQASNTGTGSAISGSNAAGATNPALTEANSSASGRGAGAPIAGDSVMREITQKTNADGSTDVATDFAHEVRLHPAALWPAVSHRWQIICPAGYSCKVVIDLDACATALGDCA